MRNYGVWRLPMLALAALAPHTARAQPAPAPEPAPAPTVPTPEPAPAPTAPPAPAPPPAPDTAPPAKPSGEWPAPKASTPEPAPVAAPPTPQPAPGQPPAAPPPAPAAPAWSPPPSMPAPARLPECRRDATPSPCVHPEDAYLHDGFYFRYEMGGGFASFSGSGEADGDSFSGGGFGALIAIGGTVAEGLVLAGAVEATAGTDDSRDEGASGTTSLLGLLVDWYPDPTGGLHFGGMAGLGGVVITDPDLPDASGSAFRIGALGGYDWWLGPQWSMGVLAILSATTSAKLSDEDGLDTGRQYSAISARIGWTITHH